jgi:putative transposase
MDDKILHLYAKGMSTRNIVDTVYKLYGPEVSPTLIFRVTNAVIEEVTQWHSRPLDAVYPIVYLVCIVVKIRQDKQVIKTSFFLALGINVEGKKELLGMWLAENEGAKFWLSVLTKLQKRGVTVILIVCVDGLKGLPDANNAVYPQTRVQLCIVRMVRNSRKFVPWKDYKSVTADLKQIYQSATDEEALLSLDKFADKWDDKYPQISKSWRNNGHKPEHIF